jgi:hypothetical protein
VTPSPESCNGIDDDCDGVSDNVAGLGEIRNRFFSEKFGWPVPEYTKVFYPDHGFVYSSCTMRRIEGGGNGLLHPSDVGSCIGTFSNGGVFGTEGATFEILLRQQRVCEPYHDVKLLMGSIDDDAYVWIGQPGSNASAVCMANLRVNGGFVECNLTGVAHRHGLDASGTWFTLKLGNGGGFDTEGVFTLVVDGVHHEISRQAKLPVHSGWSHRQEFFVNFQTGEFQTRDASACVNDGDCAN